MLKERRFYIENFGCQMNVHDSEMLAALLKADGWRNVTDPENADVVILNTCSVRDKAEQKVFSRFGILKDIKKQRSDVSYVLAGCMAKAWGKTILKRMPFIDLVVGPGMLHKVPELLKHPRPSRPVVRIDASNSVFSIDPELVESPNRYSAWVTIMEGCDNFCSYCIVPYVRGRERSRREDGIIREVEALVGRGVREVTLLGQNVNSYNGSQNGFPELLHKIHRIDGLLRIRFTTSHPKDMSNELIHAVAELPKICEYLHFPVQSGSNEILRKMKRGYTREDYLERVSLIRRSMPNVALSSDFMTGFPGETEMDHLDSVNLVETVQYDNVFIFLYNPRSGTQAADYDDDIPLKVKTKRLEDLLKRQRRISMERNQRMIDSTVEVLVEGPAKRGSNLWTGRNRQNRVVNFSGDVKSGELCDVVIESVSPNCLYGRLAVRNDLLSRTGPNV
jgi:tRNA-2-methylthio-N6-dimethylallyladenosine synthase